MYDEVVIYLSRFKILKHNIYTFEFVLFYSNWYCNRWIDVQLLYNLLLFSFTLINFKML